MTEQVVQVHHLQSCIIYLPSTDLISMNILPVTNVSYDEQVAYPSDGQKVMCLLVDALPVFHHKQC